MLELRPGATTGGLGKVSLDASPARPYRERMSGNGTMPATGGSGYFATCAERTPYWFSYSDPAVQSSIWKATRSFPPETVAKCAYSSTELPLPPEIDPAWAL